MKFKLLVPVLAWFSASLLTGLAQNETDHNSLDWSEKVGRDGTNRVVLPVNQVVTPVGRQIELHGLRPQVLALSPDGKILVTSGKTHDLVVVDPVSGQLLQHVSLPDEKSADGPAPATAHFLESSHDDQASYTGLVFSRDGRRIYLSNERGSIKVFGVDRQHHVSGLGAIALPDADAPRRKEAIPAGLALGRNGRLYVVESLSNRLLEFDLPGGALRRTFPVGAVPYGVVIVGHKAYVSNWAGRRPDTNSVVAQAGRGTVVRADAHGVASEGSVTVIDLTQGRVTGEILTGLHASAMVASPGGEYVLVANANSDTVSVIGTGEDKVVETIAVSWPGQGLFGASPNALALSPDGRTLYVCNGSQNAVAVVDFQPRHSRLLGLIPTGWYPGAILCDRARNQLMVANIKGTLPGPGYDFLRQGYNSHQHLGTLSLIPVPGAAELDSLTAIVLRNYRQPMLANAFLPSRLNVPARPVPERVGEPSVFKHVIYLIKENRTYDQVLGDIREANGDPRLCIFGERISPNEHRLVRDFVLMDNMYCCGILSADGHEWANTALASDYMEKSFCDFPRSYPDLQDVDDFDAVSYAPGGFIWDKALAQGETFRDYGEGTIAVKKWKDPTNQKPITFRDTYADFVNQAGLITYSNYPGLDSLAPYIMATNFVGWDLGVPDVYRARQFLSEFRGFVAQGQMPNLIIMDLPNDHTSGTDPGQPTPAAMVADNDLAFGQIVDAISHSPFWKDTCIFACEDDPQSGWDHVSGYRTTAYVVSAYSRHCGVVHVNYNQTSILRTMELTLGLPPMNQMDASATPMTACFTNQPDLTPYDCITNNIPLNQMNPGIAEISDPKVRHDAKISSRLPLSKPDQCPEDVLNHILWHAQMGFAAPYPDWAITDAGDDHDND